MVESTHKWLPGGVGEIMARLEPPCPIPPQMPDTASQRGQGAKSRSRHIRRVRGIALLLWLLIFLATAAVAEPLTRGRIFVHARVLQPVGQKEIPALLGQLQREVRSRPHLSQCLIDHDRLRVGLLRGPEGYTLQIESLAN